MNAPHTFLGFSVDSTLGAATAAFSTTIYSIYYILILSPTLYFSALFC